MTKTQYYAASSLDGFIADAGHTLDWLLQFGDLEGTSYPEFIREVGAIAMGSTTYEWVLRHQADQGGPAWPYEQPAWVFSSRSLPTICDADIRFVRGDVLPVHRQMLEAARGKNIWIVGGGELAGQFHDQGLLDELIIQVTSVTLGEGRPVFPRAVIQPPLRLIDAKMFGDAFAELRYEVPRTHQDPTVARDRPASASTAAAEAHPGVDEDLEAMPREQLIEEAKKLRHGIRTHRDSSLHELCWHHPALWGLLPEKTDPVPTVPEWPEFIRGCVRYRQSLDEQLPLAPRSNEPYDE